MSCQLTRSSVTWHPFRSLGHPSMTGDRPDGDHPAATGSPCGRRPPARPGPVGGRSCRAAAVSVPVLLELTSLLLPGPHRLRVRRRRPAAYAVHRSARRCPPAPPGEGEAGAGPGPRASRRDRRRCRSRPSCPACRPPRRGARRTVGPLLRGAPSGRGHRAPSRGSPAATRSARPGGAGMALRWLCETSTNDRWTRAASSGSTGESSVVLRATSHPAIDLLGRTSGFLLGHPSCNDQVHRCTTEA